MDFDSGEEYPMDFTDVDPDSEFYNEDAFVDGYWYDADSDAFLSNWVVTLLIFFRPGTSPARSTAAPWTETCSGSTSSCR